MNAKLQGQLRHLMTAIGPVLFVLLSYDNPSAILRALVSGENWQAVVGLIVALVGFWLSWRAPEKRGGGNV